MVNNKGWFKPGQQHPNWNGGRFKRGDYWVVWVPNYFSSDKKGYVLEHVYFYQEYHKVCMLPWGVVHHIDHNKENNMPWNLQEMSKSQHLSLHNKGKQGKRKDRSDTFCSICGGKTYIVKSNGREDWYGNEVDGWRCRKCNRKRYYKKESLYNKIWKKKQKEKKRLFNLH